MGEHAAGTDRGDERDGTGKDLQRCLSGLLLHVHAAAVHAYERGEAGGDRAVRRGGERQEAECAGYRTTCTWILPRAGVVSRSNPTRPCGFAPAVDPASARGSRRLQRIRECAAEGSRYHSEVHVSGDGQEREPAAEDAGFSCAGASVDGRDFEQGACIYRDVEETP